MTASGPSTSATSSWPASMNATTSSARESAGGRFQGVPTVWPRSSSSLYGAARDASSRRLGLHPGRTRCSWLFPHIKRDTPNGSFTKCYLCSRFILLPIFPVAPTRPDTPGHQCLASSELATLACDVHPNDTIPKCPESNDHKNPTRREYSDRERSQASAKPHRSEQAADNSDSARRLMTRNHWYRCLTSAFSGRRSRAAAARGYPPLILLAATGPLRSKQDGPTGYRPRPTWRLLGSPPDNLSGSAGRPSRVG
jgi:hypothetical protein